MAALFFEVLQQVIVLFGLIIIGYMFNKTKMLNKVACKCISDIVVIFVAPCVIIKSFIRDYNPKMLSLLLMALGLSALLHIMMIIISKFVVRVKNVDNRRILTAAAVLSNAGFMALPLQQAIYGMDGVFFSAAYIAIFNITLWSYGIYEISGDKSMITPKKLMLSPGIIGVVIGTIIFVFSIKPPVIVDTLLTHISNLNVPLPLFVVGYYLAETDILKALKEKSVYICCALRLVIYPLLAILVLRLLNIESVLANTLVISVAAPVGATVSMFAEKFGGNTKLSVELVSLSTILSIVTMPVIISFSQMILR